MNITNNREMRKQQKEKLRLLYDDYDPKRHDAFVIRYNQDIDKEALKQYSLNRGILPNGEN